MDYRRPWKELFTTERGRRGYDVESVSDRGTGLTGVTGSRIFVVGTGTTEEYCEWGVGGGGVGNVPKHIGEGDLHVRGVSVPVIRCKGYPRT